MYPLQKTIPLGLAVTLLACAGCADQSGLSGARCDEPGDHSQGRVCTRAGYWVAVDGGVAGADGGGTGRDSGQPDTKPTPDACTPTTEQCNQRDDDCDGRIDEGCKCQPGTTQPCYSGPKGTAGVGICQAGRRTCDQGEWGECTMQKKPEQEVCGNNSDEDCDGHIDDGCPCNYDRTNVGVCKDLTADETGTCPKPPGYESDETTCEDTADNDCDGKADYDDDDCKKEALKKCSDDKECISGKCHAGKCAHLIVVTSKKWNGRLGGLAGADRKCQRLVGSTIPGTWKAVLSDDDKSAEDRLRVESKVYNRHGDEVAKDPGDLWSTFRESAVRYDENGTKQRTRVWSGTTHLGDRIYQNCEDWKSKSARDRGEVGRSHERDWKWLETGHPPRDEKCHNAHPFYCIDGQ